MNSPFRDMDLIVQTFDDAINKLGMIKMTKPIFEVEIIGSHHHVKKDGERVATYDDLLRSDALTKAYEVKKELEELEEIMDFCVENAIKEELEKDDE